MKRILPAVLILLLAVGAVVLLALRGTPSQDIMGNTASELSFDEIEHDFGVIKQSGGLISIDFAYLYTGTVERQVIGVPTSCGCTAAELDRETLLPGDEGIMTVTFDPNLHEEPPGKFYKTAWVMTEPPLEDVEEVKIWVEIDLDLGPQAYKLSVHDDDHEGDHASGQAYHSVTAATLKTWVESKEFLQDFFLLDTHIPEQEHIPSTDAFIPFNEIQMSADSLPADKDTKIVVYCRSGSMSKQASEALIEMGYTNVYDLEGGVRAYNNL